jgi:hypothetical protein
VPLLRHTAFAQAFHVLAVVAACGDSAAERPPDAGPRDAAAADAAALIEAPLLDPEAFVYADLAGDPLASHQPAEIRCGLTGFYPERGELELDTGGCNYLYLEQPAPRAVPAGSALQLVLRHYDLAAPEPAQAHVAILFGDSVEWETTIDLPAPANAYEVTWRSSEALELLSPIRVHLHNHGQNTWIVSSLSALLPPGPP